MNKILILIASMMLFACNITGIDTQNVQPNLDISSSTSIVDPTLLPGSSFSYDAQTIVFGNQSYLVNANVSWYGSTTTWTYTITANETSKDISHFSFLGIDGCFLSSWTNSLSTGLSLTQEGNTGCFQDLTTQVYKLNADADSKRSKTFVFTFDKALATDASAAQLYVKAGSVQSGGGCGYVTIPGPSCDELKILGKVEKKVCVVNTSTIQPYVGVSVSAQQGTQILTTTTDSDGNYSFSNLGGDWVISVDSDVKAITSGPNNGNADFLIDLRPNGSCASIIGTVTLMDCFQQSSRTTQYSGAVVNCEHASCTSSSNGSFLFNNASVQLHTIVVDGVSKTIDVTSTDGVFDVGNILVDKTNGGVCGSDLVKCSLSQGYWFAKPQAIWPNGSVVIGGKTYTQAEGKAIWNTSNSKGLLNAKAAFTQASAIKLSNVDPSSPIWNDVQIVENYLASIPKLTPTTIPSNSKIGANAAAGAAAGRIGTWIQNNHCNE